MAAKETLDKHIEALNKRDGTAYAALYANDAVVHAPGLPAPLKGREAVRKHIDGVFKMIPDMQAKAVTRVIQGDSAAEEETIAGTMGGKKIEMRGGIFFRFNAQGLVTEQREYFNAG